MSADAPESILVRRGYPPSLPSPQVPQPTPHSLAAKSPPAAADTNTAAAGQLTTPQRRRDPVCSDSAANTDVQQCDSHAFRCGCVDARIAVHDRSQCTINETHTQPTPAHSRREVLDEPLSDEVNFSEDEGAASPEACSGALRSGHASETSKDTSWCEGAPHTPTPVAPDAAPPALMCRTSGAEHAVRDTQRIPRRRQTTVGPLLAVLERAGRQLLRRKLDFAFEVAMSLVFVAIGILLWGIGGTVRMDGEQLFSTGGTPLPGAYVCDASFPFIEISGNDPPCYIVSDEVGKADVFVRHACSEGPSTLLLEDALALGYECVSNAALFPVPSFSICRRGTFGWGFVLNAYLLHYLSDMLKLPSLDGIIQLQWFALATGGYVRQQALPSAQGLISYSRFNAVLCSGYLYFVGEVSSTTALIAHMNAQSSLMRYVNDGTVYASVAAAREASAGQRLWAIVEVRQMNVSGLDLVLHMNTSALPSFDTTHDAAYPGGVAYDTYELYIISGYLTLQKAVSEFYLSDVHGVATPEMLFTHFMPMVPYNRIATLANALQCFPLIFALVFAYSLSQQAKRIVQERELRLREAMLIMGLQQWTLYVCELIVQVAVFTVTCVAIALMLRLTFVTKSDPLLLFLVFFLFALTTIPLAGLIAAFVNHAEHAVLVAPVVYIVAIAPMVATSNAQGALATGLCVFSPSAFAAAMRLFMVHESGAGCGVSELRSARDNPTLAVVMGMLVGDFFVYYVLMLYVDAVVPKEWGTPKHPLFFVLDPARWLLGCALRVPAGGPDGRAADGVFEASDATEEEVVVFAGLRKEYARGNRKFLAVNNLYWGLQGQEISVLVGHNGAGKTTVLNMVTGMVAPDGGDCYVYGASVRTARSAVREELGYCPQHNILWSELTCRDHLEFYAKVKGLRGWELEAAVCGMLYEANLLEKADVAAGRLSCGQQRRLSVGIAFVGGGRLVLLDEPTAGLDVGARRQVWELLKRMSQTRAVLLTTHYMDEVDLLGSRIGMLSQGRLMFSGSSAFLKSRLGIGYRLLVSVEREGDAKNADRIILGGVRGATLESRAATQVAYRLPEQSAKDFPAVLRAVERGDAHGVRGYALSATTLEDVYVHASEADVAEDRAAAAEEDIELIWSCEVYRSLVWSQFKAMLAKRLWCALRDRQMQCLQFVCPIVCILVAMILGLVNFSAPRSLAFDFTMFGSETSEVVTLNCEHLWGSAPTAANAVITEVNKSLHIRSERELKEYLADTYFHHALPRFGAVSCWDSYIDSVNNRTYFDASICPATTFASSIALMQNTSSHHQAPVNLGLYYNLRLQQSIHSKDVAMKYTATLLDKPVPSTQLSYMYTVAVLALPFMLLPSAAAAWIVKEREFGVRSMQDMCGLSVPVYWASNFVFDVSLYMLVALVFVAVFAMFRRDDLVGSDRVGGTLLLFFVSGCTSTVYIYCWSFMFKEHGTAQAVSAIVNFFLGFAMILTVFVLAMNADTLAVAPKLRYGFRVLPSYCILEGLLDLLTLDTNIRVGVAQSVWDMDQLGWPLVYMAAEFPLFWAMMLMADHPRVHRVVGLCGYRRNTPPEISCDEDSDVEEERRAVYEAQNNPTRADVVRMVNLQKTYGDGTVAVRGVTLSVFASEVLGLLGTNGAGKTTTLSMLCQRLVPSGGSAYVCGYDIVVESAEALACVGCCPQSDATLDLLTVEEQMRLYAGVRGIPDEYWERVIAALCSLCMLTAYRKTVTCELSGGNRRKLSVALSMIGGPRVLFLDEPTAGMDPVTRRGVWAAIRRAAGYCSVVLTTHHLEEVERVADVVAIMVRGSVQCIGDAPYLREKFCRVVEFELVMSAACHCAQAERFVSMKMPGAVRIGGDGRRLVYHVPCEGGVGELFALLQAHQTALHVVDYRVSATSIEETFVRVKTRADGRGRGPTLHSSEIVAGVARVY